jgi:two-component system secretion response regulator SsrB
MSIRSTHSVLLADAHQGMTEGIRNLLATTFGTVAMVADEASLFECASRLNCDVLVVDLALSSGDCLDFIRRLRNRFPKIKLIVMSAHAESRISDAVMSLGADAFVLRRAIAHDLLAASDAVFTGIPYVSPSVMSDQQREQR